MRGGIGDRQLRELRELLAAEQHDEGVLPDQHAGGGLVVWDPATNHTVTGLAADPDGTDVFIAGRFSQVKGQARHGLAKVNETDGTPDPSWVASLQFGPELTAMAVYADGRGWKHRPGAAALVQNRALTGREAIDALPTGPPLAAGGRAAALPQSVSMESREHTLPYGRGFTAQPETPAPVQKSGAGSACWGA